MTESNTKNEVRSAVRRHVGVSFVAAGVILALALFGAAGMPPLAVGLTAVCVAGVVLGVAMHLFREKRAVQLVLGFTIFFTFMMIVLIYFAQGDTIHGTEDVHYDRISSSGETL